MIIEFKATNFRSIKSEVGFSMVARKGNQFSEHIKSHIGIDKPLLNAMSIYGPNGSGKSNVLKAIFALVKMVTWGKAGDEVAGSYFREYEPFKFDETTKKEPTCFEIDYLAKPNQRYVYSLCFTKTDILNESLFMYRNNKKVKIFIRKYQEDIKKDVYTWGAILEDEQRRALKKVTEWASGKTFLQTIGREENKILDFVRPAFHWFRHMLVFNVNSSGRDITIDLLEDRKLNLRDKIIEFIKKADIAIYDCRVEGEEQKKVTFIYKVNDLLYELPYEEESLGTKRFFDMAGILVFMECFEEYVPFIFDEIEKSLHPELVSCLLKKIDTQVIFTTHDDNMMDELRRDQILLTDKNRDGLSTELYSLADFNGIRKDAIKRNIYKKGVLGAYPFISFGEDREEGWNEQD